MNLEQKFKKVVSEVQPTIDALVREASENLKKAQRLSNQHGVPFESDVVPFDQKVPFIPRSMMEKYHDDDAEEELDDDEDGYKESFEKLMEKASCSTDYIHRESRPEVDFGWNGLFEQCWNSSSLSC